MASLRFVLTMRNSLNMKLRDKEWESLINSNFQPAIFFQLRLMKKIPTSHILFQDSQLQILFLTKAQKLKIYHSLQLQISILTLTIELIRL